MAPSSSGPGRVVLNHQITGSNPVGATKSRSIRRPIRSGVQFDNTDLQEYNPSLWKEKNDKEQRFLREKEIIEEEKSRD